MVLKRKLQTEQNCLLCWSTYLGSTGKRERGFAVGDLDKLGRSLLKTSSFVSSVRVVWSWELAKVDSGNWESWSGSWDVDKSLCFGGLRCLCRSSANIFILIGAWKRLLYHNVFFLIISSRCKREILETQQNIHFSLGHVGRYLLAWSFQ